MTHPVDPIVSPSWLAERLGAPETVVLDATWFMPGDPRDARAMHEEARIPGARHFEIDVIADQSSNLPHMLPSPAQFAAQLGALGVSSKSIVVVYDAVGLFSAARAWWSLRAMGHENVFVLDGGLPAWRAAELPIESGPPSPAQAQHFKASSAPTLIASLTNMRSIVRDGGATILDARPAGRFTGADPEPRPGLARGHLPGSRNTPWASLVGADGKLKPAAELEAIFASADASLGGPIVCSCGSGVSAAIIALALARLGRWDAAIYDGSWAEWGAAGDVPIATGPA